MIFGKNKSLACFNSNPNAEARLVCFPCAGGGASMYRSWGAALPDVEVWSANYPGRESLHSEPFAESVESIVDGFLSQSDWFVEKPVILYGHSFGSLVGFLVAHGLLERGVAVLGLCASARRAPHLPAEINITDLPESRFLMELERLGGLPEAIRSNQEMMDFYLPVIKADLALNDRGLACTDQSISAPIYLYSAADDKVATADELAAWKNATTSHFEHKAFEGGHFFIQDNAPMFLASLRSAVATLMQDDDELIAF